MIKRASEAFTFGFTKPTHYPTINLMLNAVNRVNVAAKFTSDGVILESAASAPAVPHEFSGNGYNSGCNQLIEFPKIVNGSPDYMSNKVDYIPSVKVVPNPMFCVRTFGI